MHTLGKPVGTTSLATDTYQLRVWLGLSEFRLKAWTNVSSVVQLLLSRLVIQKKCFVNVLPYWIFLCFLSVQFNYLRTLYSFNWRHFKRCISFLYLSSMKCILNALSCRLKPQSVIMAQIPESIFKHLFLNFLHQNPYFSLWRKYFYAHVRVSWGKFRHFQTAARVME